MKKVMIVFGTRPEAIKMCPLVVELKKHTRFRTIVCVTGQHREMLDQVLNVFGIKPDIDLSIMKENQSLFDVTSSILMKMDEILEDIKPDIVLVHGDTSTTFATSLSCFYKHIKIGHVEAGLRTNNMHLPFPEEFNRQCVGLIANIHFAPTEAAKENLIREGKNERNIYVTGNTAIDALKTTIVEGYTHELLKWVGNDLLILITVHRRENIGEPMRNIFSAIRDTLIKFPNIKAIYPIHMNPIIKMIANEVFTNNKQIKIVPPLNVIDFHNFLKKAHIILTDSGGIQEEAPSLGIPVLVLRDETERPEGVRAGTLKLVGTNYSRILYELENLLTNNEEYDNMSHSSNPYGDGNACKYIVKILEDTLL